MPVLKADHGELHYERAGSGPALLLIHGLGSSSRDWAPQLEAFSANHTVIAPDLRGHGRTPGARGRFSLRGFAEDVAAIMADAGFADADVVGLSLGGAVAFQLAVDYPERVRSLTIVNSSPSFVPRTRREHLMVLQRLLVIRLLGMRRMGQILAPRLFPDNAALRDLFVEQYAQNRKSDYLATLKALVGWSVAERLPDITCPTLVVSADQDYTPVADKQAYVDQIPQARLAVIANAHHAVTAERPDAFNCELGEFLKGKRAGRSTKTAGENA
ncbi:alpha/beta fold hydrolase [Sinimarinibacterium sp. CAU 1509]|uniref:alpha/beta fold hydrolase n=1 Tax=Sinimarinibacterium sp. CAU 1509 TaxID=2562283 RepID=UPI0010AC75F2|nr:alpha/beta fold hydrolase [Sinimarinibacterium sp. CAU 1509]TJY59999.1 alpha/beta fold hydrolase [Sinimarinibacterium sp. CAU 1509]